MKKQLCALTLLAYAFNVQPGGYHPRGGSRSAAQPSAYPSSPASVPASSPASAPANAVTVSSASALLGSFPGNQAYVLQGAIDGTGITPANPATAEQQAAYNAGKQFVTTGSASVVPAGSSAQSKKLGRLGRK